MTSNPFMLPKEKIIPPLASGQRRKHIKACLFGYYHATYLIPSTLLLALKFTKRNMFFKHLAASIVFAVSLLQVKAETHTITFVNKLVMSISFGKVCSSFLNFASCGFGTVGLITS